MEELGGRERDILGLNIQNATGIILATVNPVAV
jgi:hypothetical protein